MAVGAPELLVIVVIFAVFVFPTVFGLYRAFSTGRTGWGVAIIAAWLAGLGWLVAIVYLLGPDRRVRAAPRL